MNDPLARDVPPLVNGSRQESRRLATHTSHGPANLADLLERVLDKGIVIAGDITLCLGEIELLQLKIRLLIASADKAREMGIDWWQHDPALCSRAGTNTSGDDRAELAQRLDRLEALLAAKVDAPPPPPPATTRALVSPPAVSDRTKLSR